MDLKEYQRLALATAQPEAFSPDYLVPGIVGEVGELLGQRAKAHWHGWPEAQLQAQLVKEYGDVAWMTAVLLHTYDVDQVHVPPSWFIRHPELRLLRLATNLYEDYCYAASFYGPAARLWQVLAGAAEEVTGSSFDHVLQVNLDKLASRAERGVLRGAGDDR